MKLPALRYADRITKSTQMQFGGLNHNPGALDGEIWDMKNMTAMDYPLLSSRPSRRLGTTLGKANGITAWDGLYWVDGTSFCRNGEELGPVTDGEKTFAALGAWLVILPDKAFYNTATGELGSMESSGAGESLTSRNGSLYGAAAAAFNA